MSRLSTMAYLAVLGGCAAPSLTSVTPKGSSPDGQKMIRKSDVNGIITDVSEDGSVVHTYSLDGRAPATVSSNGYTLKTVTNGNTVSLVATDSSGNSTTVMTATMGTDKVATYTAYGYGTYTMNWNNAVPSSLAVFGHTVAASTSTTSTISGPVISGGNASLTSSGSVATAAGTYKSVYEYRSITDPGSGGGITKGCTTRCPLDVNNIVSAIFSGIAFVAGIVALALFLPEMTVLAVVLAVIDVLASWADFCWNVLQL